MQNLGFTRLIVMVTAIVAVAALFSLPVHFFLSETGALETYVTQHVHHSQVMRRNDLRLVLAGQAGTMKWSEGYYRLGRDLREQCLERGGIIDKIDVYHYLSQYDRIGEIFIDDIPRSGQQSLMCFPQSWVMETLEAVQRGGDWQKRLMEPLPKGNLAVGQVIFLGRWPIGSANFLLALIVLCCLPAGYCILSLQRFLDGVNQEIIRTEDVALST